MDDVSCVHFIGAAGIGMRGLVRLCLQKGWKVTGSDNPQALSSLSALTEMGFEFVPEDQDLEALDPQFVVYSSAIAPSHPQRVWAESKERLWHRAQFLASFFNQAYSRIAVTGTHGKTTVSSWLAHVLGQICGSSYCVGGIVRSTGLTANLGTCNEWVIEADESDGSLKYYEPTCAVITNINDDHLNHWKTIEALEQFMLEYAKKSTVSVICQDDARMALWPIEALRYGFAASSDLRIESFKLGEKGIEAVLSYKGQKLGSFTSLLMGRHNVQNMAAVVGVCLAIGMSADEIRKAVASFNGAGRRLEFVGEVQGIKYFDDYAVHPTEVETTIEALRSMLKSGEKLRLIFQPHRTTRLESLMDHLAKSFYGVDELWLCPLYLAAEAAKEGVNSESLAKRIGEFYPSKTMRLFKSLDEVHEALKADLLTKTSVSVCSTMGAGNVTQVARAWVLGKS
jgi:UDP-N-acetylmuramate--alanine ligase